VLSYDGTDYLGWQSQPGGRTVQDVVREAARRILGETPRVTGASRTDAGVHALRQTASLTTTATLPAADLRRALNAVLPGDVRVMEAADAAAGFDARRAAIGKRYAYLIDNAPVPTPFLRRFAWAIPRPLDVVAMREALGRLVGRHDFAGFCAAAGRAGYSVCHVRAARLVRRKDRLAVVLSADHYLHHMVRNIVGTLVAIGRDGRDPAWVGEILASRDRRRAGVTAPAHGLTLVRVLYPE
jgi:tRNA pseudouridine38-40 synthase